MNLLQTQEPTPHPVWVRAKAFELADEALKTKIEGLGKTRASMIIDSAKEIEKYLWGHFAPIEKPPTPLNTISETLQHAKTQLIGLKNSPSNIDAARITHSIATLERLISDVTDILTQQGE